MTEVERSDVARVVAHVSGYVQGVGFRVFVRRTARELGLSGIVQNLEDGRVKVVAEGPRGTCAELIDRLHGETPGSVQQVHHYWTDAEGLIGFLIG